MTEEQDVFYYITVMNESWPAACHPGRCRGRHHQGHVPARRGQEATPPITQLLGSGTILREVREVKILRDEFSVAADVWSVTSFNELRRDLAVERSNQNWGKSPSKPMSKRRSRRAQGPR
jgi:pyruvate dehydrogenase E1 component